MRPFEWITAIPLVFPKVIVDDCIYIDGGIIDNFPLTQGISYGGTHILALTLSKGLRYDVDVENIFSDFYQLIQIPLDYLVDQQIMEQKDNPNVEIIRLGSERSPVNFKVTVTELMNMFSYGYNKIKDALEKHNI